MTITIPSLEQWQTWAVMVASLITAFGIIYGAYCRWVKPSLSRVSEGLTGVAALLEERPQVQKLMEGMAMDLKKLNAEVFANEAMTLRTSLALHRAEMLAITDYIDTALYICDSLGVCTYANHNLCDLFGMSQGDFLGSGWLDAVMPDQRQQVQERWMYSVVSKTPYGPFEYDLRDGSRVTTKARRYAANGNAFWVGSLIKVPQKEHLTTKPI